MHINASARGQSSWYACHHGAALACKHARPSAQAQLLSSPASLHEAHVPKRLRACRAVAEMEAPEGYVGEAPSPTSGGLQLEVSFEEPTEKIPPTFIRTKARVIASAAEYISAMHSGNGVLAFLLPCSESATGSASAAVLGTRPLPAPGRLLATLRCGTASRKHSDLLWLTDPSHKNASTTKPCS